MSKFKTGDIVRITGHSNDHRFKTGEVVRLLNNYDKDGWKCEYLDGHDYWWVLENDMEYITAQLPRIEITPKKNGKVSATIFNGNTYVKHATAKCSPDDTYDFNIGAKLAFNRLMGIEDKPNSADTFDWEKFKKGEIAVKCPTEELAINFLTECDKRKIKWVNERKATSETNFYSYKEKTYYGFGFGCLGYGSIERECFKKHYKSSIEWTTNGAVIPQKLDLSHVTNEELIAELTKRLEQ